MTHTTNTPEARNVDAERSQFETWATRNGLDITPDDMCGYESDQTKWAWLAWGAESRWAAAPAGAVPPGWRLVPEVPTDEMIVAFAEGWYSQRQAIDDPQMGEAYRAMLAAAPTPPAAPQEAPSDEEIIGIAVAQSLVCRDHGDIVSAWREDAEIRQYVLGFARAILQRYGSQPADQGEDAYVIERMGNLLAQIAVIVRGPEPELKRWSYHDLPERVAAAIAGAQPAASVEPVMRIYAEGNQRTVTEWLDGARDLQDGDHNLYAAPVAAQPQTENPVLPQDQVLAQPLSGADGLLPCPFCGGAAKQYDRPNASTVTCTGCGAKVRQSEMGQGDAPQKWNRRAQPQPSGSEPPLYPGFDWMRWHHETNGATPAEAAQEWLRRTGGQHQPSGNAAEIRSSGISGEFDAWIKREYPHLGPIGDGVVIAREAWSAALAAQPQRLLFPAHLRKMWSGGEVQSWLDEQMGVTPSPVSARGSLERYRQWQATSQEQLP